MESRVLIHYVKSDGKVWAEYLFQKLGTKQYEINCEQIEFNANSVARAQSSILNVFFVTPDFLDVQDWEWSNQVDKNTCMLVLTGTDDSDLEASAKYHHCEGVFDFYVYQLKETEDSVRDLLIFIITKYEDGDPQRAGSPGSRHSRDSDHLHHAISEPKDFRYAHFAHRRFSERARSVTSDKDVSYSPKLSRSQKRDEVGSNYDFLPKYQRQVNGVRDVLYKDGKLYLLLWRRAEGSLKVKLRDDEFAPVCTECSVYEIPCEGGHSGNLTVIQDGTTIGEQFIQAPESSTTKPVVFQTAPLPQSPTHSKASAQPSTESVSTQTTEIHEGRSIISRSKKENTRDSLYVNFEDVSRESPDPDMDSEQTWDSSRKNRLEKIRQLLEEETDPEELLCQCLGIDKGVRHLDEKMSSMIQSVETLRHLSFSGRSSGIEDEDNTAWPTLVHFGAQFNLLNFCDVLLSNPLMYGACVRKNKDGNMPHDIARIHGHNELAEMLKHFSEFVRAEKERDSGISGLSSTPRLSTITMAGEPPPPPHRPSHFGDNYIDMNPRHTHEGYTNEREVERLPKYHSKRLREVSKLSDGGFCGSFESDDDYLPMSPVVWDSTRVSLDSSHSSSHTLHASSELDPERCTIIGTDEESDPDVEHKRKDVATMLGMKMPASPDDKKAKGSSKLRKLFFGNKSRSKSEPSVLSNELLSASTNKNTKVYHRDSTHSSSSTASTYSDSSFREEDGTEVQMRGDKKQHSGKSKIKGFLKTAKKRQSVRINRVMADHEMKAPALPSRPEVF